MQNKASGYVTINCPLSGLLVSFAVLLSLGQQPIHADTTNFSASADTFINSTLANNNAGSEGHVAAGRDGAGGIRRGLFIFDATSIQPGSTVTSVTVQIAVTGTPGAGSANSTFGLHRVTEEWTEGNKNGTGGIGNENGAPATTGETTWVNKKHNVAAWQTSGGSGDFISSASAGTFVTGVGTYSWASTGLIADVQFWVDNPGRNYGLMLISQSEGVSKSARQFGSSEGSSAATLLIGFDPILLTPPSFTSISTNSILELSWQSETNRKYDVSYTDNLLGGPVWQLAEANITAATNATNIWSDPPYLASPAYLSNSIMFYRLSMLADPVTPLPLEAEIVVSNLVSPTVLTHAGDGSGRLFVADQLGQIRIINSSGTLLPEPFLDIVGEMTNLAPAFGGASVGINPGYDERGLLGLTFHPDYSTNGKFYVYYSSPKYLTDVINHESIVAEYTVSGTNANIANPASRQIIFRIDQPEFNHNGGALAFGPDTFLYIALGDGGGAGDVHPPIGNGQENTNVLGTILRIDVDSAFPYASPSNNPFVGQSGRDEVYAYGLRNPWKMSFDSGGSNEFFVADVGQDKWEEVNIVQRGGNYGWRIIEGKHIFDAALATTLGQNVSTLKYPIHEYPHGPLGISIIGGYVYRGTAYSALQGKYVFGDFSTSFGQPDGALYYIEETRAGIWERFEFNLSSTNRLGRYVKGFGEGEDGELYLLSTGNLGPNGISGDVRLLKKP